MNSQQTKRSLLGLLISLLVHGSILGALFWNWHTPHEAASNAPGEISTTISMEMIQGMRVEEPAPEPEPEPQQAEPEPEKQEVVSDPTKKPEPEKKKEPEKKPEKPIEKPRILIQRLRQILKRQLRVNLAQMVFKVVPVPILMNIMPIVRLFDVKLNGINAILHAQK